MPADQRPAHHLHKIGRIPTMDGLMYPVLVVHSGGKVRALCGLSGVMSDWLGLSPEQRARRTECGNARIIDNRTRRAVDHLYRAELLGKERRGRFVDCRITQEGESIVADPGITSLTRAYLERTYPPYREWVEAKYRGRRPP